MDLYSLMRPNGKNLDDMLGESLFPSGWMMSKKGGHGGSHDMKMDIRETENSYEALFDIPGVPKDSVKISHEGQTLTVTVDHKEEKNKDTEAKDGTKIHWRERRSGFMKRSVTMPDNCNFEKATAKQDHGVLTISFPKTKVEDAKKYIAIK